MLFRYLAGCQPRLKETDSHVKGTVMSNRSIREDRESTALSLFVMGIVCGALIAFLFPDLFI